LKLNTQHHPAGNDGHVAQTQCHPALRCQFRLRCRRPGKEAPLRRQPREILQPSLPRGSRTA
jgi:hypothetical protein